jgi:predicted secreted hydrolase
MGKLSKISILVIAVSMALLILAVIALISGTQQSYLGKVLNDIDAFIFDSKSDSDSVNNESASSQQSFGRGFNASTSQNLGDVADPNYIISFPKDHAAHESFDIEWWYLTANLQDNSGNAYGLQWTLFRFRNPNHKNSEQGVTINSDGNDRVNTDVVTDGVNKTPSSNWNNQHIYMAHASVHSANQHWFSEKFARGKVGNAGVESSLLKLFIDDWQWQSSTAGLLPATLVFNAELLSNNKSINDDSKLNVSLNLSNTGPFVLQGQDGYSIKSADGKYASHYYSAPFIQVEGKFLMSDGLILSKLNEQDMEGSESTEDEIMTHEPSTQISVKGNAWFDQEWTSQLLDQATLGWDWLSLHLDNGDKIMAFRMRLQDQPDYITGTYIQADGSTTALMPSDINLDIIEFTKVGNKNLPLHWALSVASKGVNIKIISSKDDQWNPALVAYYEGSVALSGTHTGKGFLELTGY